MGLLGRRPWCRALITLGTPHRGASRGLAWLVSAVPGAGRACRTLRTWPSVTKLLPRDPAVFDAEASCGHYPHERDSSAHVTDVDGMTKLQTSATVESQDGE